MHAYGPEVDDVIEAGGSKARFLKKGYSTEEDLYDALRSGLKEKTGARLVP